MKVGQRIDRTSEEWRDYAAQIILRHGGRITPRELSRHLWRFRQVAGSLLHTMATNGYGTWEDAPPGPRGGRPSRVFLLAPEVAERISGGADRRITTAEAPARPPSPPEAQGVRGPVQPGDE